MLGIGAGTYITVNQLVTNTRLSQTLREAWTALKKILVSTSC